MRPPHQGPMDDKERYMRWLERMWHLQKLDPRAAANTDREESRTEEILTMFEDLGELARRRRIEPPEPQPWRQEPD